MTKWNPYSFSALALVLVFGCGGSSKSDPIGESNTGHNGGTGSTQSNGNKGGNGVLTLSIDKSGGGGSGSGSGSNGSGSTPSTGSNGTGASSTGARPGSLGGMGSSSGTYLSTEGGMGTSDPPPATGGDGYTTDPPPGDTVDPPPGDTVDPPPGDTVDPPPGDTIDPPPGDTIDPPPGDTSDPPDTCTMTEIDKVNVIVFKDAKPSGADSEGKMWVGGNLTTTGYTIGANDLGASATKCADTVLVVGGNSTGSVQVKNGMAAIYGTATGVTSADCGFNKTKPVDFAALETKLKSYSLGISEYPSNGDVKLEFGKLTLTGTDATLNIFTVTDKQLSSVTNVTFSVPSTSSVIVNVTGTTIEWQGGDFTLPGGGKACKAETTAWCHRILWNMYEATSVTIYGIGVQGSILAPLADFHGKGGNVDGQVIVKTLDGITEYHSYFFSGCLLLPKGMKP